MKVNPMLSFLRVRYGALSFGTVSAILLNKQSTVGLYLYPQ